MSDIGGADPKLLVAAGQTGDGAVSDGDPVPWDKDWHNRFEDWRASTAEPSPVILLFCKHPGISAKSHNCEIHYQFGIASTRPQCGVYLVGKSPTGNGWKLPLTGSNYQDYCKFIQQAKLDDLPAIVIGKNGLEIIFLPCGINHADGGVLIPPSKIGSPLDDEILTPELQHFADYNLVTQELRKDLWEDAGKYWPTELAEKTIQKFLLISLRAVFKDYIFLAETPVVAGRIDIWILPGSSDEAGRSVLELKAVRQFGSSGNVYTSQNMVDHLKGGIDQAVTYFKDATHKYLCAYDMRKEKIDSVFKEIEVACEKVGVKLRTYVVHPSATSIRSSIVESTPPKNE